MSLKNKLKKTLKKAGRFIDTTIKLTPAYLTFAGSIAPAAQPLFAQDSRNIKISGNVADNYFKNSLEGKFLTAKDLKGTPLATSSTNQEGNYDLDFIITDVNDNYNLPSDFKLEQNYPNPFNPRTKIGFNAGEIGEYTLTVHNALGQLIDKETQTLSKGAHTFNVSTPSQGVFFYTIAGNNFKETKKMVSLGGKPANDYITHSNGGSFTNLSKSANAQTIRLVATDTSRLFAPDSVEITLNGDEFLQDFYLNQNPRNGNMNLSGQLTAQPTGAKADATLVNINGNTITTNNGFFESDVALEYITNQADTTQKVFNPEKVDLEFFGEDYFTNSKSIDATIGSVTLNSDINQKKISKNATLTVNVKDENGLVIPGTKVSAYKASNDSLMFSGNPGNIILSYSGFNFDDDATFNNIGSVRVEASANGYITNSETFNFANPMSSDLVLSQSKKSITVTGQVIDNKFGTVVQSDVAELIDKANGAVYASDNNSSDGIILTGSIPKLSDVEVRITNPTASYSNKFIDISEESQNLGNINREQIPVLVTMTGQGSVTAKPTNYTQASNVNVNFAGNNVTTNNGFWSSSITLDKYVNPVNSNDKLFEPTTVLVSWSGDHYQTASQNVSSVEGTKTINKDLTQTTYEKTASLETIVKEGSSPVSGASVIVKNNDNGTTLKTGITDSKGEKNFSIAYQGYEFDDDATYSNISQLRVIASKDNYETNSETFNFANPMSTTIFLTPSGQLITITGQTLDNKFGTRVQNDVINLKDKDNGTIYDTDNNSADGMNLSATIPNGRDIVLYITNSSSAYNNQTVDVSEQSQNLNITRNQNPVSRVMNLAGNVTLSPTNYTNASDVNVAVTGEGSTTTSNGSWSRNVDFNEYVNPVNSSDKLNEPSLVTITWSGPNYVTSSSDVLTQGGSVTKNKTLEQTRINATANLEVIVNDGSNPVNSANVVVKDGSSTLNSGTTNTSGIANFDVAYTTFRYASDPISFANRTSLDITASKTDYESNSKNIPFDDPMSTTISITPIGQEYILDTYFRLYETDGDVVSASKLPNVKFEWNGETITVPNVNGKAHIYKVYTGSNPETNVTILPPNTSEYLGTMALTTVNPNKVERLAQSETQASGMDIAVSTLNNAGDEELYLIPGTWYYGSSGTTPLDADGTTVQKLFNRSPIAGTSSHKAVGSYPKIIVFKGSFHEETGAQMDASIIATRDAQIDAYLSATQMPHKKLLDYEVKTFSSWTDPNWTSVTNSPRGGNNITWAVFGNLDGNGIEFSLSDPEKYRILNSNSSTTNSSTPAGRMSEFFSSMTNTTGQLAQYVTNPSTGGTITNAGKNMMGIVYIFKPATRFWQ